MSRAFGEATRPQAADESRAGWGEQAITGDYAGPWVVRATDGSELEGASVGVFAEWIRSGKVHRDSPIRQGSGPWIILADAPLARQFPVRVRIQPVSAWTLRGARLGAMLGGFLGAMTVAPLGALIGVFVRIRRRFTSTRGAAPGGVP